MSVIKIKQVHVRVRSLCVRMVRGWLFEPQPRQTSVDLTDCETSTRNYSAIGVSVKGLRKLPF